MNLHRRIFVGAGASGGGGVVTPIGSRIRISQRRLLNDAGWFANRGVADFGAIGHELKGRGGQVDERFDWYAKCSRTVVRVLGMLADPSWVGRDLAFGPRDAGYWNAMERRVSAANARGIYVKLGIFADAQMYMPSHADRKALVREFAAFCREHQGVIPQMANEPYKNGWSSADDPQLLELAQLFASEVGHRDFYVGDVGDSGGENNTEGNNKMVGKWNAIGAICNGLDIHSSRDQPAGDSRYSRAIDHLEGFTELFSQITNRDAAVDQEEPIGSHPVCDPGRRECRPDAQVAGMAVGLCCAFGGYTLHWIPEEDGQGSVYDCAGLDPEACAVLARMPSTPEWIYLNDSWQGAPTEGITWTGKTGKVRNLVRGNQAWTVAYGEGDFGSVKWRAGWTPRVEYASANVCIWSVNQ